MSDGDAFGTLLVGFVVVALGVAAIIASVVL